MKKKNKPVEKKVEDAAGVVARSVIGKKQERIFTLERGDIDTENRTVDLSFSSEEPGERWYGIEILSHDPSAVRLNRLNDGGAVLFNHNTDNHIGIIESGTARLDAGARKARATVRFGKGVLASEKFGDVNDGILRNVSVGYMVHKMVKENEADGVATYRVTDWEPLEVSFVPVPMDATVGVGRSAENAGQEDIELPDPTPELKEEKVENCVKCGTALVDGKCPTCAALEARQKETVEILAVGKRFGKEEDAARFIAEGKSLAEFKDAVLAGIGSTPVIQVTKDETDKAQEKGFPTFGHALLAAVAAEKRGGSLDKRLVRAASGMGETVPSDGGFVLQDTFSAELLAKTNETGVLYPLCRKIPIGPGSNSLSAPVIDETSRATGSRFGGLQLYWDGEGDNATSKKVKLGRIDMKLNKLHGLAYVTEEMLQDSAQLEAIVKQAFAEEFGFMIDDGIIRGSGAGEMLGILNSGCLVSIAEETSQADDTILAENVLKMYQSMPARNKANAVWLYNDEVFSQLATMYVNAGAGGVVGFMPPGGLSGSPYGTLMGRPLIPIEQASAIGDVGDLIFADLSEYLIIEKGAMDAAASIHYRFIYDEMTFKFTMRINGQPIWKSALTPYKGSISKSPFVAIAAR